MTNPDVPRRPTVADRSERVPSGLRTTGSATFGTWVKLPTIETVELLAGAGFEFVVVDLEHSPLGLETAARLVFAAQALGMAALVRVPDLSGSLYQRLLDCGADGLLVPRVATVDEVTAAVAGTTFSPEGHRGMGITSRAGTWGLARLADYRAAGETVVRCVQIEDLDALRRVDALAAVPGLGAIFLGMGDLLMSCGRAADDPEIVELTDRFVAAANTHGLACGTAVGDADAAAAAVQQGFSFVMVSNDATIFGRAAAGLADDTRRALAAATRAPDGPRRA